MTKPLAFSPAISGKLVLLPVIPGKLVLLSAIPGKPGYTPVDFRQSGLAPGDFVQQKTASSFRLFRPAAAMQFFFFRFLFRQDFASRSISFQALTPRPITISGSHTQANHNFRLSHPSQSQFQALTPKPITISGSHIGPAIYPTYCSFRSPLR